MASPPPFPFPCGATQTSSWFRCVSLTSLKAQRDPCPRQSSGSSLVPYFVFSVWDLKVIDYSHNAFQPSLGDTGDPWLHTPQNGELCFGTNARKPTPLSCPFLYCWSRESKLFSDNYWYFRHCPPSYCQHISFALSWFDFRNKLTIGHEWREMIWCVELWQQGEKELAYIEYWQCTRYKAQLTIIIVIFTVSISYVRHCAKPLQMT